MAQLVFLVSLPRSGSTLLQRMLSVSTDIACTAEPWVMLPFWGMRDPSAGRAVYFHHTAANAINDFIAGMPAGEKVFDAGVRAYAETIYQGAAQGKRYFLDKTPRYFLMLPMLRRIFPEARFIVLTRNPLAVLASIGETFYHGRFMWPDYWIDWLEGHAALANAINTPDANLRVVRYESLAERPAEVLRELCDWLDLPYSDAMISEYREKALHGRMGDPTGIKSYAGVSNASLHKWQSFWGTDYRRGIARRMLDRIGDERLAQLGYPRTELETLLVAMPLEPGFDLRGRLQGLLGQLALVLDYRYWQARYRAWRAGGAYANGYFRVNAK